MKQLSIGQGTLILDSERHMQNDPFKEERQAIDAIPESRTNQERAN